jgi:alpha-glucoside transport system substrate-binding protein
MHRSVAARRRVLTRILVPASVALLALTACSNVSDNGNNGGGGPLTGDCAKYQAFAGHSGTTVTMFASIISPESDSLQRSWSDFSRCTGITISYEGANDFESQLPVRVAGGNAPDLAIIPQPGLLAQMVKSGKVQPPNAGTVANVDQYWNKAWKSYGTVNGTFYAAPMSANMKSLVWYSPKAFAAAGYTVPKTWDEMMSLSDKIAKAGKKPWCGGISSGTATGWPATDWLEQVVLRTGGGDVYDKWVAHTIKFNSPEITAAMQTVQNWILNPKYVNGGFGDVKSIATTTFQDAGKPILNSQCFMLQQASFYGAQWPAGTNVAEDGDAFAFYLPPISTSVPTPVIGGGEFVTAFGNRPEVKAVQQ